MSPVPVRLLVVGGTGFIGRHVVGRAVGLGWNVTSLSLHPTKERKHPECVRCVIADISDRNALSGALAETAFEYVVHCGSYIDHTPFFSGGRRCFQRQVDGIVNLAGLVDRDALGAFVNIGSADEYGANLAPQIETQREMPISPYSAGKVAVTHFLQMLYRTEGFPATTLRAFLTYGPGQGTSRFLPSVILGCLRAEAFPTSGGQQLRDFCFVDDTVDAIFSALAGTAATGEVINIGSGAPISIRRMTETIQQFIGAGEPKYGAIAYRPGENMELYADISKATAKLGWAPRISLEDGLWKTIRWFRDQL